MVSDALTATYIRPRFWSDEFQLRFAWSETVARPDLREISDSAYIDPLTEITVRGNPDLVPSDLSNIDLRAEWFWDSGDNMTVSLFYKDIADPIETVQREASEDSNRLLLYQRGHGRGLRAGVRRTESHSGS